MSRRKKKKKKAKRNPVAKFARLFNKAAIMQDETKYNRKKKKKDYIDFE